MASLGAIQKYASLAASGKLTRIDVAKHEALDALLFDVAMYQHAYEKANPRRKAMTFDFAVGYLRRLGMDFTESQESVINQARFRNFDKKLHQEYAALLMSMSDFVKNLKLSGEG